MTLGDSWISPLDFVRAYSPFLKAWSLIDEHGQQELDALADQAKVAPSHTTATCCCERGLRGLDLSDGPAMLGYEAQAGACPVYLPNKISASDQVPRLNRASP